MRRAAASETAASSASAAEARDDEDDDDEADLVEPVSERTDTETGLSDLEERLSVEVCAQRRACLGMRAAETNPRSQVLALFELGMLDASSGAEPAAGASRDGASDARVQGRSGRLLEDDDYVRLREALAQTELGEEGAASDTFAVAEALPLGAAPDEQGGDQVLWQLEANLTSGALILYDSADEPPVVGSRARASATALIRARNLRQSAAFAGGSSGAVSAEFAAGSFDVVDERFRLSSYARGWPRARAPSRPQQMRRPRRSDDHDSEASSTVFADFRASEHRAVRRRICSDGVRRR